MRGSAAALAASAMVCPAFGVSQERGRLHFGRLVPPRAARCLSASRVYRRARRSLARPAADSDAEAAFPDPRGRVFAVPTPRFRRSVAMYCRELEVVVGGGEGELEAHVAGLYGAAPAAELALEGRLLSGPDGAALQGTSAARYVDFEVLRALGPWHRQHGAEPRLRQLQMRQEASLLPGQQLIRCGDMKLPESAPARGSSNPPLTLFLDTAKAYHWMRFGTHLLWARYVVDHIHRESSSPQVSILDLGGGSGWMSALLKAHLELECTVLCTDIASEALELAEFNFAQNGLEVEVEQGDMFEPILRRGPPYPDYAFFNPPQVAGTKADGDWKGSPNVALLSPGQNAAHFHMRFCSEALLAPGGIAWLGVNWELLAEVVEFCCRSGWYVTVPGAVKDATNAPSLLLELQQLQDSGTDHLECVSRAMEGVESAAEYQIRGIGATDDRGRTELRAVAAKRGIPAGQTAFGAALAAGLGVARDEGAAAELFGLAATAGDACAQYNLGALLAKGGRGVLRDANASTAWLRKSAAQGNGAAQQRLVAMFMNGDPSVAGDADMPRWIRRTAELGDANAQLLFAKMHMQGEVVPQSNSRAAFWLWRAAKTYAAEGDHRQAEALLEAAAALDAPSTSR